MDRFTLTKGIHAPSVKVVTNLDAKFRNEYMHLRMSVMLFLTILYRDLVEKSNTTAQLSATYLAQSTAALKLMNLSTV